MKRTVLIGWSVLATACSQGLTSRGVSMGDPSQHGSIDASVGAGRDASRDVFVPIVVRVGGSDELLRHALSFDASMVAMRPESSVESGEIAWLVSHLADNDGRAMSVDTYAVQSLAGRGSLGVQAIVPVFVRGDARRAPHARRVIERVAQRACGMRDPMMTQRLVLWIENGASGLAHVRDAGAFQWTFADDQRWSDAALTRLSSWINENVPCEPTELRQDRRNGVGLDAGVMDDDLRDAGRSGS